MFCQVADMIKLTDNRKQLLSFMKTLGFYLMSYKSAACSVSSI